MRISRTQLAGIAVLLSGASTQALAQTTINTATTTPLLTSNTGELLVDTTGTITIDTGQVAITVDSDDDVEVQGNIIGTNESNVTGILINGPYSGDIIHSGLINFLEDHTRTDTDNDGNPDGPWSTRTNVHGIFLDAGGTWTGNLTGDGAMNIEGNNSSGITLNSLLDGDINLTGGIINMTGDNSVGIAINQGVTGDVLLRNGLTMRGENSIGLDVNGDIGGEIRINGAWTTSGYSFLGRPNDTLLAALDADDLLQGGPAVALRANVVGGITIEGIGIENDEDDDDDGDTADNDDDRTAVIESYGEAAAVLIEADGANINIGAGITPGEYGFLNRGVLNGNGVFDGFESYALQIQGVGGNTATITGGIRNDGTISATSYEANAYALFAGADAIIDRFNNRKLISSLTVSDANDTSYAVYVASGGTLNELTNNGSVRSVFIGELGNAVAIYDASGTLLDINNTGLIQAVIGAPAGVTPAGDAIAIDVSNALAGVTITQTPDVVFNDDDTTDNDAMFRPPVLIEGDILLGAFADTINLQDGIIVGDISFGNGADVFNIDGGATFGGTINDTDGLLTLNVNDGVMELTGGALGITQAQFGADSRLIVHVGGTPVTITATGTVNFDAGAVVTPIVPAGLPGSGSHTFLIAGNLTGASNVTGLLSGQGVSFLYNIEVTNDIANELAVEYTRKNAAQLGLNNAQAAGLNPILAALSLNANAAQALANIDNQADFLDSFADLMPNYAGGATEMAATAIQQLQSATTNRLATTRLRNLDEVSVWAQEIGYGISREPSGPNGLDFRGQGFGLAGGIDGPLNNGGLFGLSAAFLTSEVEEPGRPEGEISSTFGQVNAYLGTAMGAFDLDFVGGLGAGRMSSRRFIEIGDTFSTSTEADWWAFEGHGAARASLPLRVSDWFVFTPQAALTYVALQEQGYQEEGAGAAFDYDVDSNFSQRLWADVGFEISGRLALGGRDSFIAPRLYLGYRANGLNEASERTVRFVSGGADFTVQDDDLGDGGPLVGLGIDATNGHSTFSIAYEGEFGDQLERHSLNAAIRFRF